MKPQNIDEVLDEISSKRSGALGSGGVASKVAAARMAAWSGIPTVIAPASDPNSARLAVEGADVGTWVEPHPSGLSARKLWIGFGLPTEGVVDVDEGAMNALVDSGRSLLPAGVSSVTGEFDRGSAVRVTSSGRLFAKGLVRMKADEIRSVVGQHSSEAGGVVIHRDDLVILA